MPLPVNRRRAAYLLGLAVLVLWACLMAMLGPGGNGPAALAEGVKDRVGHTPAAGGEQALESRPQDVAGRAAAEFLSAYLRYEVGETASADRAMLARLCTESFGVQLLRAPVRVPPSAAPPREWVSRVQAVRVGIFKGQQALLVSVVVVGPRGARLLTPTLVQQGSRWLVAGLGA